MPARKNVDGDTIPSDEELRSHSLKRSWETRRARGTVYKFCHEHAAVEPAESECFSKTAVKRADIEFPQIQTFTPYFDEHIGRYTHKGQPVLVRSKRHKKQLLKANNLAEVG